jgi:hypothetical protein
MKYFVPNLEPSKEIKPQNTFQEKFENSEHLPKGKFLWQCS